VLVAERFKIKKESLFYQNKKIKEKDMPSLVFFRSKTGLERALQLFFEARGTHIINTARCNELCDDKLKAYEIVESIGAPQPKFLDPAKTVNTYEHLSKELGEIFIAKNRFGYGGSSVYLIKNKEDFAGVVDKPDLVYQEYIGDDITKGKDMRTFLTGGEVVGAIIRKNDESFLSNISTGGYAINYTPTEEEKEMSKKIAKALHGEIISVDYLIKNDGSLLFCEANTDPDLLDMQENGHPDIFDKVVLYIKQRYF